MTQTASSDYYGVLGVPRDASEQDIRAAYRRLARQYHPDVSKEEGAEERFKEISEAYEVLRDPQKREQYDRFGGNWRAAGQAGAGGRGAGRAGAQDFDFGDAGGVRFDFGDGDLGDIFDTFFGGGGGFGGGGARRAGAGFSTRGSDEEAVIELSLEEAAEGGRRHVTLADGREYDVNIPRGVRDGQRIRLAGEGARGIGGGPTGDLFLRVRLRPHPRFRVEGRDLHTDVRVAPWEAALGATVDVPTLSGSARLKIPAGSSCGRKLRLRGNGMPGPRGQNGDMYATVQIKVPRRLSADERRLFQQLAETSNFDPRR